MYCIEMAKISSNFSPPGTPSFVFLNSSAVTALHNFKGTALSGGVKSAKFGHNLATSWKRHKTSCRPSQYFAIRR